MFPFYGDDLQQRMDIRPLPDGNHHIIGILTAVKYLHIIKVKVHNMDLAVVLPDVIPEPVNIMAPVPAYHHQILPIQIADLQDALFRQRMVYGHRTT